MLDYKEEPTFLQVPAREDPVAGIIKKYLDRVIQLERELQELIKNSGCSEGR